MHVARVGSFVKPTCGLTVTLGNSLALDVEESENVLRPRQTLACGLPNPSGSARLVGVLTTTL